MITKRNKTVAALFVIIAFIVSCNTNNAAGNGTDTLHQPAVNNTVAVYTFPVDKGYGYVIFVNDKAFIKQDCIPVIQGNKPFANKGDAAKTGELVAQKIRDNQLPTLTQQDLNDLAITQ